MLSMLNLLHIIPLGIIELQLISDIRLPDLYIYYCAVDSIVILCCLVEN